MSLPLNSKFNSHWPSSDHSKAKGDENNILNTPSFPFLKFSSYFPFHEYPNSSRVPQEYQSCDGVLPEYKSKEVFSEEMQSYQGYASTYPHFPLSLIHRPWEGLRIPSNLWHSFPLPYLPEQISEEKLDSAEPKFPSINTGSLKERGFEDVISKENASLHQEGDHTVNERSPDDVSVPCEPYGISNFAEDINIEKLPESPSTKIQFCKVKWTNHSSRIAKYFSSLDSDTSTCDVIITNQRKEVFPAHKLVLASASPYLAEMLKNISSEITLPTSIIIPLGSNSVVSSVLSFCYTGVLRCSLEDIAPVFELAELLEITGVMAEKEKYQEILPLFGYHTSSSLDFTRPAKRPFLSPKAPNNSVSNPDILETYSWESKNSKSPLYHSQPIKKIKAASNFNENRIIQNNTSDFEKSRIIMENRAENRRNPNELKTMNLRNKSSYQIGAGSRVLLWRFLLEMLHDDRYCPLYIRWLDRPNGIFRIMESDKVAQLWGLARKNKRMTYEKMSRGMRTYYKRAIMFHLDGTKLIYRFNTDDPDIKRQMDYYDLISKKSLSESSSSLADEIKRKLDRISIPELRNDDTLEITPNDICENFQIPSSVYCFKENTRKRS